MILPKFGYDFDLKTRQWHRCSSTGRRLTAEENAAIDAHEVEKAKRKAPKRAKAPPTRPALLERD